MWIVLQIIVAFFVSNYLGLYTRHLFLKLIRRGESVEYLSGKSDEGANAVSHSALNFIVGMVMLFLIMVLLYFIDEYIFQFL